MTKEVYQKLGEALNARSVTIPSVPCDEFFAFAEALFTPEQAELACSMPLEPVAADDLAAKIGEADIRKVEKKLEEMADKGLITVQEREGKKYYEFLPFVPGIIELQFMKGEVNEHAKRLTVLLRDYLKAMRAIMKTASPPTPAAAPAVTKTIPVNEEVSDLVTILPYDEVMRLIDSVDYVAAGVCVCRHQGDLLDRPCSKPKKDMCMILGSSAQSAASRGFARLLSKEEARRSIDEAEEAGLVHSFANSSDKYINLLCNCCGCHCLILRNVKRSPVPSKAVFTDWVTMISTEECNGCGACVDRCWMGALKQEGDTVVRDAERCIGCGVCMYVCPADAMKLERRELVKL
ncbi:MAG: 4Fe-4S binding protein [Dehalococcoidia bacterium]|nr:4Fe-4S binding protein [Dehalococcoidia bacterium]